MRKLLAVALLTALSASASAVELPLTLETLVVGEVTVGRTLLLSAALIAGAAAASSSGGSSNGGTTGTSGTTGTTGTTGTGN